MLSTLTDDLQQHVSMTVAASGAASTAQQWHKSTRRCLPAHPPRRRRRGITLIDMSVLLTFAAIVVGVAAMERVRGQARDFAISSGLELREVLDAAMVYRYQTGEWPLNQCSRSYAQGLGNDCNGDGSADSGDLSGLTQLVEVGRLPDLQRHRNNQGRDGQWISLQPWDAATAAVSTNSADIASVLRSDSLRMETVVGSNLSAYANYIARLVPGTEVEQRGADTVLVTTLQFGGYSAILLSQLGLSTGYFNSLRVPEVVLSRRVILDAPQPGLLRIRPYIETDPSLLGSHPRRVRVNTSGERLSDQSTAALADGDDDPLVITNETGELYTSEISINLADASRQAVRISPSPALVFGVAALEDSVGMPSSDSGDRVELRAISGNRLQIVERDTAVFMPDGTTPLRQDNFDGRPLRKLYRTATHFLSFDYVNNSNETYYYLRQTNRATQSYEPRPHFIDSGSFSGSAYDGLPPYLITAQIDGGYPGRRLLGATRTALMFAGIYDHPDTSPALFPNGAPAGTSALTATAREGHARIILAHRVGQHSYIQAVRRVVGGALNNLTDIMFNMDLWGSMEPAFAEQLFLDDAPAVQNADIPGRSYDRAVYSRTIDGLFVICHLPELLTASGNTDCGNPRAGATGPMDVLGNQTGDLGWVIPRLSVYFSATGGYMNLHHVFKDINSDTNDRYGEIELWSDGDSGNQAGRTVQREPGRHRRVWISGRFGLRIGDNDDAYQNYQDSRALRVRQLDVGIGTAYRFALHPYITPEGASNALFLDGNTEGVSFVGIGVAGQTETAIIDFGGSTDGARTPLRLQGSPQILVTDPSTGSPSLNLWYGASDHPVVDDSRVPFMNVRNLAVESLNALDCFKCAGGTASDCPHVSYTDYGCP